MDGTADKDIATRALVLLKGSRRVVVDFITEPVHLEAFLGPVAYGVLSRCTSRVLAIEALLEGSYYDEAAATLRSLASDSMRLRFLQAHPSTRTANVLWWWNDYIGEVAKLAHATRRARLTSEADALERWIGVERRSVAARQQELGVAKLLRLPAEGKSLADAVGDTEGELDYLMGTNPSHSALGSVWQNTSRDDSGVMNVEVRRFDATMVIGLAARAAHHYLLAASAVASIIGRDLPALRDTYSNVGRGFAVLRSRLEP